MLQNMKTKLQLIYRTKFKNVSWINLDNINDTHKQYTVAGYERT